MRKVMHYDRPFLENHCLSTYRARKRAILFGNFPSDNLLTIAVVSTQHHCLSFLSQICFLFTFVCIIFLAFGLPQTRIETMHANVSKHKDTSGHMTICRQMRQLVSWLSSDRNLSSA